MGNPSLEEAHRLIKISLDDFNHHIAKETDLSIILIRGHLLVEYYLSLLILLEYDKTERIDRLGFFYKIKKMENAQTIKLSQNVIQSLYKLNDLRNNLAHNLEFKISIPDIDTIGFSFGREYVLSKYKSTMSEKDLLMWVINKITGDIFYYIYAEVAKDKNMLPIPKSLPDSSVIK